MLTPGDNLLIMDMNLDSARLTLDEMRRLADVGCTTVYYQGAIHWDKMQPTPGAAIDFSDLDAFVMRARQVGLKMLVPIAHRLPAWKPDEWFYSRDAQETACGVPNYWNEQTGPDFDQLATHIINRYHADDFQVIYAIPGNGEFAVDIWPRGAGLPGDMQVFVDWVCARQRVLAKQHAEVWTAYHPYTNPTYWQPVYDALFDEFAYCKHYGIIFTYVQHGMDHFHNLIHANQQRGMTYFGGVEYVQGMRNNVPILRERGVKMLCAPKHPYQSNQVITGDMLDTIRWALGEYDATL